jgi:hypothetical protein
MAIKPIKYLIGAALLAALLVGCGDTYTRATITDKVMWPSGKYTYPYALMSDGSQVELSLSEWLLLKPGDTVCYKKPSLGLKTIVPSYKCGGGQ